MSTLTTRTLTIQDKSGTIALLDDIPDALAGNIWTYDVFLTPGPATGTFRLDNATVGSATNLFLHDSRVE